MSAAGTIHRNARSPDPAAIASLHIAAGATPAARRGSEGARLRPETAMAADRWARRHHVDRSTA
jgi:hypothetical protein